MLHNRKKTIISLQQPIYIFIHHSTPNHLSHTNWSHNRFPLPLY